MKIAITGSSGLIGTALTSQLNHLGHTVVHLVRSESAASDPLHCWWNPQQGVMQLDKLSDVQVLVHLAGRSIGEHRWTSREKELIYTSRVEATKRLCASLQKLPRPLELMLGASAVGIYGDRGESILREGDEESTGTLEPEVLNVQDYHSTEFLIQVAQRWEAAARVMLQCGTPVVHARLGVVLSPEGGALAKMLPLFRWGLGSNLGSGQQYWSWIALEDVVRAMVWIIERRARYHGIQDHGMQAINLTSPNPVTNAEFTRILAERLKRFRFLPVPKFALRLGLGEMADAALLASCRAIPDRLASEGFQFQFADLKAALDSFQI